ncbi:MAG: hypothetical protein WCQ47_02380 [bacterium]
MKNLFFLAVIFLLSTGLRSEVFGSAGTLKPGVIMFGVEPQINIRPTDLMGYFHFGIGIIERMDLEVKLGTGTAATYFGGDLEYQFLKSNPLDFSISFGPHYQDAAFIDITPIFTHRLKSFALSTGPKFKWQISKGTYLSMSWFAGASIPLYRSVEFLMDAGIEIRGNNSWVSAGLATYL